jgi:NDP-sugar pyrophosphorylase family protein
VLAGAYPRGQGALEALVPRPLLPVAHKPLIAYPLLWMRDAGLERVTITVNTEARDIRERLGETLDGLSLDYHEDWTPRGAAGCARDAGVKTAARRFVVAEATVVPVVDSQELLEAHQKHGALTTVVVGADESGRQRPSGIYVFEREALELVPEEGFQDIKEKLIPDLYGKGRSVATFVAPGLAPRVFSAETYLALNHWVLESTSRYESLEYRAVGEARVHESATVAPTARLLGPILLGPRVRVDERATVIGPVTVGAGSLIGPDAVVSRSVLWEGCVLGDGAFVDRSMLGDGVVVGPRQAVYSTVRVAAARGEPVG